ncbi:uncharacterized protein LOC144350047 [Saccoglossus kowalevskii]
MDEARMTTETKLQYKRKAMTTDNVYKLTEKQGVDDQSSYQTLFKRYPWLIRTNTSPNYYTSQDGHSLQDNSTIVFVHHNKAGGQTIKSCLFNMTRRMRIDRPRKASYKDFVEIFNYLKLSGIPKRKFYEGGYAFGLCDRLSSPCSYFTVLRDPYERMVSHYLYCKVFYRDQICRIRANGSNHVTVVEWATLIGSMFFKQLFNDVDLCSRVYVKAVHKYMVGLFPGPRGDEDLCWKIHQVYVNFMLSQHEKDLLLRYFLDNMENWFTVIGIVDEMDITLDLLQTAYQVPFSDTCKENEHVQTINSMAVNDTVSKERQALVDELQDDPDVALALHYDLELYKEAVYIFQQQKLQVTSL